MFFSTAFIGYVLFVFLLGLVLIFYAAPRWGPRYSVLDLTMHSILKRIAKLRFSRGVDIISRKVTNQLRKTKTSMPPR